MRVAELWRYPVKSMGGEALDRAYLDSLGIAGDRVVHVEDGNGQVINGKDAPSPAGASCKVGFFR